MESFGKDFIFLFCSGCYFRKRIEKSSDNSPFFTVNRYRMMGTLQQNRYTCLFTSIYRLQEINHTYVLDYNCFNNHENKNNTQCTDTGYLKV